MSNFTKFQAQSLDELEFTRIVKQKGLVIIPALQEKNVKLPAAIPQRELKELIEEYGLGVLEQLKNYHIDFPKTMDSTWYVELIAKYGLGVLEQLNTHGISYEKYIDSYKLTQVLRSNGLDMLAGLQQHGIELPKQIDGNNLIYLVEKYSFAVLGILKYYKIAPPTEIQSHNFLDLFKKYGLPVLDNLENYNIKIENLSSYGLTELINLKGFGVIKVLDGYGINVDKSTSSLLSLVEKFGVEIFDYISVEDGFFAKKEATKIVSKIGFTTLKTVLDLAGEPCLTKIEANDLFKIPHSTYSGDYSVETLELLAKYKCLPSLDTAKIAEIISKLGSTGVKSIVKYGADLEKSFFYADKFNVDLPTMNYLKFLLDNHKIKNDLSVSDQIETYHEYATKIKQVFSKFNPDNLLFKANKLLIKPMLNEYESESQSIQWSNLEFVKNDVVLQIKDGLIYDQNCQLFNAHSVIYVMDTEGNLFASNAGHHSYILNIEGYGVPTAAAGHMTVQNGKISSINGGSGHYQPISEQLILAFKYLANQNVFSADANLSYDFNSGRNSGLDDLSEIDGEAVLASHQSFEEAINPFN